LETDTIFSDLVVHEGVNQTNLVFSSYLLLC